MNADRRAKVLRDLDKHAREAVAAVSRMKSLFSRLFEDETGDSGLSVDEVIAAENALQRAPGDLSELQRIFARQVRLLGGPQPRITLRDAGEGCLDIIAETPDGELKAGHAERTRAADEYGMEIWHAQYTDTGGRNCGSSTTIREPGRDGVMDAVTRHMDEYGPWWAREEGSADG